MPRYDYRCRACGETFEVTKPIAAAGTPSRCPSGHDDTVKLLSTLALAGRADAALSGGCCGGACGCG